MQGMWLAPNGRTEALIRSGKVPDVSMGDCQRNYRKALEKGVLKILSKMGISLLSCYHGAQIFEIYGLGKEVGAPAASVWLRCTSNDPAALVMAAVQCPLQCMMSNCRVMRHGCSQKACIGGPNLKFCRSVCWHSWHTVGAHKCCPGCADQVVDLAFKGSVSRIGGMSLADLQREAESFWLKVWAHAGPTQMVTT